MWGWPRGTHTAAVLPRGLCRTPEMPWEWGPGECMDALPGWSFLTPFEGCPWGCEGRELQQGRAVVVPFTVGGDDPVYSLYPRA